MKRIFVFAIIFAVNVLPLFASESDNEFYDNWEKTKKIITENIGSHIISGFRTERYLLNNGSIEIYIHVYIIPGNYGTYDINNIKNVMPDIQSCLPSYIINIEIIYPFIIIFNKVDDTIFDRDAINNELPFGVAILDLFNNSCYGQITESRNERLIHKVDLNKFVTMIIKHFGTNSIMEM